MTNKVVRRALTRFHIKLALDSAEGAREQKRGPLELLRFLAKKLSAEDWLDLQAALAEGDLASDDLPVSGTEIGGPYNAIEGAERTGTPAMDSGRQPSSFERLFPNAFIPKVLPGAEAVSVRAAPSADAERSFEAMFGAKL